MFSQVVKVLLAFLLEVVVDEATVFNASHLMGFFSVFNQDAIKDVQLYKGGIPSIYGGRLSSILDVRMNDGNNKTFHAKGGIGTISSRLTVEGPIVKEKGSFVVSARRTYADLFLLFSKKEDLRKTKLYFYDLNGKASYTLNKKNRIYLSAYTGRDITGISDAFKMSWGNKTITTRWNHLFTEKVFSNLSLIFSNFDYLLGQPSGITGFEWKSNIKEYCLKNDYTYYINSNNTLNFGIIANYHTFLPAEIKGTGSESIFTEYKIKKNQSSESGIYLSNTQKIGKKIEIQYGARYSKFYNIGPDTIYNYNSNYDTTGYKAYKKGEFFHTFGGIEPRINFRYSINEVSSIKASYNRMMQYIHLASNSTASMPLDIWFSSNPNIKPQIADQVAIGYFRNLKDNMYEVSIESYYKKTTNQIDFADHATLIANPLIDGQLRIGKGEAYGLEFLVRKNEGVFNGWISYTLSKSTRKVPDIYNGNIYPSNYDRRHNLAVILSYDITERLTTSLNWVYYTGVPFTAPTGRYTFGNMTAPVYSERNQAKLPDYHRLDVSIAFKNKKKKATQKWESEWVLSVYNVYNRKNPYSITFREKKEDPTQTEAVMTYLFPILPAITYNFKF